MELNFCGRRFLSTLPIPGVRGIFIYPAAAFGVAALMSRAWTLGVALVALALILYFFFVGDISIILSEADLRKFWFRRIPRSRICKVQLACYLVTELFLKRYLGYVVLDDGSFVLLEPLDAWPYQRRRQNSRVMRQAREVAEWTGVSLEVIDDLEMSPNLF